MNHPMLNIAIQAARNASKIILRFIDHIDKVSVTTKNKSDFVTEVDRLAEQEIIDTIRKAYPQHAILAEERGYKEGKIGNEFCWIIDPLDGTTNYIHRLPHYAVSIAVKYRDKLEIAVVYDPIQNELFTAAKGAGAQLNNQRIRVSTCKNFADALIGTGFPVRNLDHLDTYISQFKQILSNSAGIRRAGSAALDLAYTAAGRLDGFWESGIYEWDMAAGILLIQEAGGMTSDFTGGNEYFKNNAVIAGNPRIFKMLLDYIAASSEIPPTPL